MSNPSTTSPVGRLAPSPTGRLHLGHARSFLLAWWSARSRGGRVVLRIEDLDTTRSRPELVDACVADLEWLGLDWDGPALRQSAGIERYAGACRRLLADRAAYACVCSRAEIAAASAPHVEDRETRYPGTCRGRWSSPEAALSETGRHSGLRLVVPEGRVPIDDRVHGTVAFDVDGEVGDFLIRRRDGVFAYQLAVVVDDHAQGVTEVLRGDDLLSSAARQAVLLDRLDLPRPDWVHVPLVTAEDGSRLSKRRGDLALTQLREEGVDPRAVVGWAARSAGQPADERARADEVAPAFDLGRLPREPVALSEERVAALRRAR